MSISYFCRHNQPHGNHTLKKIYGRRASWMSEASFLDERAKSAIWERLYWWAQIFVFIYANQVHNFFSLSKLTGNRNTSWCHVDPTPNDHVYDCACYRLFACCCNASNSSAVNPLFNVRVRRAKQKNKRLQRIKPWH